MSEIDITPSRQAYGRMLLIIAMRSLNPNDVEWAKREILELIGNDSWENKSC